MTQNYIAYANYLENVRNNQFNNAETERTHRANENIGWYNAGSQRQQADASTANVAINSRNADTNALSLAEKVRSDKANEDIGRSTVNESVRTHKANEAISRGNLSETTRSNKANEAIKVGTLNESVRHNQATEGIQEYDAISGRLGAISQQQNAATNVTNAETRKAELKQTTNRDNNNYIIDTRNATTKEQATDLSKQKLNEVDIPLADENIKSIKQKRITDAIDTGTNVLKTVSDLIGSSFKRTTDAVKLLLPALVK